MDLHKWIELWLKAWKNANAVINKRAETLYDEIYKAVEADPSLFEQVIVLCNQIATFAADQKYVEAMGRLSMLAICLLRAKQKGRK